MRNTLPYIISRDMVKMYLSFRVSRSAAAFSYFLTLTVFPMLICLYTMLRQYIPDTGEILFY